MLIVYKKINVCLSKSLKVIFPKNTNEETNFESIRTNIIDTQIVYKLHDTADMITFYKKANLNMYNRVQNTQDYILKERLKVNIIPKHVVYASKGHDFNVYLAGEFIFIVYSKDNRNLKDSWTWKILVYDTKRNISTQYTETFDKSYGGIYGFYYLEECRKAILPVGNPIFSDEVFYKSHDRRRGFNLRGFYVIYLDNPKNNCYLWKLVYITPYIRQYIQTRHSDKCAQAMQMTVDYTIDTNSGLMYMVCKVRCRMDVDYKSNVVVLEYDLCSEGGLKIFEIEVLVPITEAPTPTFQYTAENENILLYLSNKHLRNKNMPKYLPMYISSEFYDFMSNKLFHADMIFSSHSQLFVKDRHFNRVDAVLAKIESLKIATHIPLQDDIITMRNGRNNKLQAVLIINDLAIVKSEK